ncbi:MAG: OprD family outer membrane porin [Endozoicomonas sp. (ex Botrylloides leachii)]|nr:OprD family outer membrane porin [Endozoicomonas sp. (ex Botrylloides leachii)]
MKLVGLSALSIAMLMATTSQANVFLDDSTLDINLKNYYKNNKVKNKDVNGTSKDYSRSQWAQAIGINFSSGYYYNLIGVDAAFYHSLKIRGDQDSTNGLLQTEDDGSVKGYGKTAYAVKINLMDYGVAKYGRMFINTPLLNNTDSRALPSLTEGFYGDVHFDALSLYGIIAIKENDIDQSGFDSYGYIDGNNNSEKRAVSIIGGNYDFGYGFSTNVAYGKQKDFSERYFADANYSTAFNSIGLDFGLQYGRNSAHGKARDLLIAVGSSDTSQHAWGAKAQAHVGAATVGVNYTAIQKTDIGDYAVEWLAIETGGSAFKGDGSGYFGYNSSQYSDFNRNGQKSWGINASYNFEGIVNGLNLYGVYVRGKANPNSGYKWVEKEYNLGVSYHVPMIEGLSAHVLYARNSQEDQGLNSANELADEVNTDTRVIVQYNIAVF